MNTMRWAMVVSVAVLAAAAQAAPSTEDVAPHWQAQAGRGEALVVLQAPPTATAMDVELWLGVAPWGCRTPLLTIHNTGETSIATGGAYERGESFALGRLNVDAARGVLMGFKVSSRDHGEMAIGSVATGTAERRETSLQLLESMAAGKHASLEFVDIETGVPIGAVDFDLTGLRTALRVGRQMCTAAARPEAGGELDRG